eukprot:CAMPEP_0172796268 /NCGR_PEP_ID=MMETSP1074-20121228/210902_1 /TAXON_ID=2916 /ORGANISM="Ceratium fusus, Strain PA161109" /LENGTH=62 /DNA_ID=CAMNT_0013633361 /DNA_START=57 /DNA_END=242 /DNA_ORIENTATION=+
MPGPQEKRNTSIVNHNAKGDEAAPLCLMVHKAATARPDLHIMSLAVISTFNSQHVLLISRWW